MIYKWNHNISWGMIFPAKVSLDSTWMWLQVRWISTRYKNKIILLIPPSIHPCQGTSHLLTKRDKTWPGGIITLTDVLIWKASFSLSLSFSIVDKHTTQECVSPHPKTQTRKHEKPVYYLCELYLFRWGVKLSKTLLKHKAYIETDGRTNERRYILHALCNPITQEAKHRRYESQNKYKEIFCVSSEISVRHGPKIDRMRSKRHRLTSL